MWDLFLLKKQTVLFLLQCCSSTAYSEMMTAKNLRTVKAQSYWHYHSEAGRDSGNMHVVTYRSAL